MMQSAPGAAERAGYGGLIHPQTDCDLRHIQPLVVVHLQHLLLAGRQLLRHGSRQIVQQALPPLAVVTGLLLHPKAQSGDIHGVKGGMHHGFDHSCHSNVRSPAPAGGTDAEEAAAPAGGGAAAGYTPDPPWSAGTAAAPPSAAGCAGRCPHTVGTFRQVSCAITLLLILCARNMVHSKLLC